MKSIDTSKQKLCVEARQAIQGSDESVRVLARKYKANPKTIVKWKKRDFSEDRLRVTNRPPILSDQQQKIIVYVQQKLKLTLDQVLFVFEQSLPQLSRSTLYRCLKRHGVELAPERSQGSVVQKAIKYKIGKPQAGRFLISHEENPNRVSDGVAWYRFTARDILTGFSYSEKHNRRTQTIIAEFMKNLIAATPYKISAVMTDGSHWFCSHVAHKPRHSLGLIPFEKICHDEGIKEYFKDTPSEALFLAGLDLAPTR